MAEKKVQEALGDDFSDEGDEDTQKDKFLTFYIDEEEFGIAISHITEIVGLQRITEVPDMPPYVKGVVNLRGNVIPVIDMRMRFGMEPRKYDDRTCLIIVNIDSQSIGFVVDRVHEVVDIPEENISAPPMIKGETANSRYIKGLGKVEGKVKILLDVAVLVFSEGFETMANAG